MKYNYHDLLENMHDGVYFVDLERRITFWNRSAESITGHAASDTLGSRCSDNLLVHVDAEGNNLCQGSCPLAKAMKEGVPAGAEVYLHHKKGYRLPVRVSVMPLRDGNGVIVGGAEFFSDNSDCHAHAQRAEELQKLALLDSLTSLSNRKAVEVELFARIQEMERFGASFGVLFLDIDHFKLVNDTYGHDAGDLVLKTVAQTISRISRPFDFFGRWGGEEFLGIIRNVGQDGLVKTANRYRALIEKSMVHLNGASITVTVSAGVTIARKDDTPESLVARADRLMYASKEKGRNCLTVG